MGVLDTSKSQSIRPWEGGLARRPLLWLNLACLDAPLVALMWQQLFAITLALPLTVASRESLFLTAWLIYLADRLADSLSLSPQTSKSVRQEFCREHIWLWTGLIGGIAIFDATIVLFHLDPETRRRGLMVAGGALAYLVVNHFADRIWRILPLKEISIGSLFAAGTLVAVGWGTQTIAVPAPAAMLAIVFFALLCSLNCMSIAAWERDLDHAQQRSSIATRWPRIERYLTIVVLFLVPGCALLALKIPPLFRIAICIGSSALLLFLIRFPRILRDERTALADLVLFTPLLVLAAERLR